MGEVWLARDRALGRDVALKAMRPSDSASRTRRFEREARALAALDHPSILPVLHAGEDPATGLRYLVTPAVLLSPSEIVRLCDEVLLCPYPHGFAPEGTEGGAPRPLPLAALLDGGKALPQAAVLRIARDLAGALAAAHAAGIIHRDVKPSNVLFDASGRALLADFGLAKFTRGGGGSHAESAESAESPDGRASASPDGRASASPDGRAPASPDAVEAPDSISLDESGARKFLGSPAYAAPEQFRDGAALTPALDWYSLGAVLYEALTGERPRSLRPPSSYDPSRISRRWDSFLRDLLEPDPARRLADPAAITRRLDALGRALDPATRSRRRAARAALAAAATVAAAAIVASRFHAEPGPAVESPAESEEFAEPGSGVEKQAESAESAEPSPVTRHLSLVTPAAEPPVPPRLDSVWQGENRGPLQLLGVFRLDPVERLAGEALASADPETRRLLREGDEAWSSWHDNPDAFLRAIRAWTAAVTRIEETSDAGGAGKASAAAGGAGGSGEPPDHLVLRAFALVRLAWTYVANAEHGGADEPFRKALAAIDPLVESDAPRYGPLRSWILSERAYMECMEGRFRESAADLQEAGLLWARYAPADDPGCEAQRFVLAAAFGGMLQAMGDTTNAVTMTSRAAEALNSLLFHDESERGSGDAVPRSLADLLAGCLYRLGEFHRETGTRIASVASYRRAAELWRDLFKTYGERYRTDCIQALGRLGQSLADAGRLEEAVAAWDEVRDLVAPVFASDPALYRPVVAATLDNLVRAHRILGDEDRALEAEAAALRASP